MRHISFFLICFSLGILSCKNDAGEKKQDTTVTETTPQLPPQSILDNSNTQRLMTVVVRYYDVKDALVISNPARADVAARSLKSSALDLQQYLQADSANATVLLPYLDTVVNSCDALLAEVKDKTAEKKRIAFEQISNGVYGLLKAAQLKNANVYRQYCPMAFNDKGAYWLSRETEIRNPYFGDKMLECGEVTDTLN